MADFILGHSDLGYLCTFTGGTWDANLTRDYLNNQFITAIARTDGVADLELDILLPGLSSTPIEVLGIINHNLTPSGTYRWTAYDNSGRLHDGITNFRIYDSGTLTVGTPNENIAYKTLCTDAGAEVDTLYWRLNISDSGNTAPGFTIGRLFMGSKFHPEGNMDYGLKMGVLDDSTDILESHNGIESFVKSLPKRVASFTKGLVSYSVGDELFDMQLKNGISGTCLFELDPDRLVGGMYTFACRQQSLSPLDYPSFSTNKLSVNLVEIL